VPAMKRRQHPNYALAASKRQPGAEMPLLAPADARRPKYRPRPAALASDDPGARFSDQGRAESRGGGMVAGP